MRMLVGMGVPSKYFTLPVALSDRSAAVTLKRARRLTPHTTKKVRHSMSQPPRRPSGVAEDRRRDAKRDDVGQRVEIGADPRLTAGGEARHVAVEHVAHQRKHHQQACHPQQPRVAGREVLEAQEDRDGAAAGVADRQHIRGRVRPQHRHVTDGRRHVFSLTYRSAPGARSRSVSARIWSMVVLALALQARESGSCARCSELSIPARG